ncbi:MAG: hypothetical protein QM778_26005 [Myxococcales bacterium]
MFSTGCEPDAHQVEGAIARSEAAASNRDSQALFQSLDERARSALHGMVKARKRAADVIQTGYPKEAQAEALASLGDALQAESGEALFALRCPEACMDALAARLSPPRKVQEKDRLAQVETLRGEKVDLYRADDGTYGLVWNSEALRRESTRSFAELDLIKRNADMYAKQRALK